MVQIKNMMIALLFITPIETHASILRVPSFNQCIKNLFVSKKTRFKDYPAPTSIKLSSFVKESVRSFNNPEKVLSWIQQTGGDFTLLDAGAGKFLFVSDPAISMQILKNTSKGADSAFIKSEIIKGPFSGLVGRKNIFSESEFEAWREKHQKMAKYFTPKSIEDAVVQEKITSVVKDRVAFLKTQKATDLKTEMSSLTLEILLKTFFNESVNQDKLKKINKAFEVVMESFPLEAINPTKIPLHLMPKVTKYQRRLKEAHTTINEFVNEMVAKRNLMKEGEAPQDLLNEMILYFKENPDIAKSGKLTDEIKTFILSGHETTSSGLGWAFYRMMTEEGLKIPKTDLELKAFWDETLFKHPPAYVVSRKATKDFVVLDQLGKEVLIPKDMEVIVPLVSLHKSFAKHMVGHSGTGVAFGAGPRVCLGRFFADSEAMTIMKQMMSEFHFEPQFKNLVSSSTGSLQAGNSIPVKIIQKN